MDVNPQIPDILEKSFSATGGAIIYVTIHKFSLAIGEDKITFDLFKATYQPFVENVYCKVN